MTITDVPYTARELHSRVAGSIHVRLPWNELSDQLKVAVTDTRTGTDFAIDIAERERTMHVFNQPFAYAA